MARTTAFGYPRRTRTLAKAALLWLLGLVPSTACVASSQRALPGTAAPSTPAATPGAHAEATGEQLVVPLHSMGVTRLALLGYPYWAGRDAYGAAESAAARQQWPEVEQRCRSVLGVNPDHARARRLLASALAMQGKHAEAVDQLEMALADDWLAWAPELRQDPTLRDLFASSQRTRLDALIGAYESSFVESRARGFLAVGRFAPYAPPPTDRGQQPDTSRAEIVLYDPYVGRYHRVTHTEESVLGFQRMAGGDICYVVNRAAAPASDHWQLARLELRLLDGRTLAPKGKPVSIASRIDRARVHEAPDGSSELLVWDAERGGREPLGYRIDWEKGTLTPLAGSGPAAGEDAGDPGDLDVAHWATALVPERSPLTCTENHCAREDGAEIELPASQSPLATWTSPDHAWLAVWTADRSCGSNTSALLLFALRGAAATHVVYRGTGSFHHARWLSDTAFLFEADGKSLHQFDVTKLEETAVVNNPAGIALDGLGVQSGPCDPRLTPKLAAIVGDWIRVFRNIEFETNSAELLPESFVVLDDVATVLRRHQDISLIEIQGHTDRHASTDYNRQLSVLRAEAVREDLTKRCGIAPHRLVVTGYGESKPLDRSPTEQADAKNRRVSFKILKR